MNTNRFSRLTALGRSGNCDTVRSVSPRIHYVYLQFFTIRSAVRSNQLLMPSLTLPTNIKSYVWQLLKCVVKLSKAATLRLQTAFCLLKFSARNFMFSVSENKTTMLKCHCALQNFEEGYENISRLNEIYSNHIHTGTHTHTHTLLTWTDYRETRWLATRNTKCKQKIRKFTTANLSSLSPFLYFSYWWAFGTSFSPSRFAILYSGKWQSHRDKLHNFP